MGHSPSKCDPQSYSRSRREAVIGLVGGCTLAIASLLGASQSRAQSKTDKKTAKYQDQPNNGQSCSQCRFFLAPKSCQLVEGDISPNGWCSFFSKKT